MKNSIFLLLAGLFFFTSPTLAQSTNHLFILSGQSNMARLDPAISFTPTVAAAFGEKNITVVHDAVGGSANSPLVQRLEIGNGRTA